MNSVNGGTGAISNVALTTGNLSQFAATTSAQLLGVISDETGSGSLVFGTTPTIGTPVLNSPTVNRPTMYSTKEFTTVSATAAAATVQLDFLTQSVLYYTSNATANWTFNVRGNIGVALSLITSVGDGVTVTFLNTNGTTAYYPTSLTIDGVAQTVKWQGGVAPSTGNASSVDAYVYTIFKTAATPTYSVFASQTKFA